MPSPSTTSPVWSRVPESITEYAVSILGVWTLASWICVYAGVSFSATVWVSWVAIAGGVAVAIWRRRRSAAINTGSTDSPPDKDGEPGPTPTSWFHRLGPEVGFVAFVAGAIVSIRGGDYTYLFWGAVAYLIAIAVATRRQESPAPTPPTVEVRDLVSIGLVMVASLVAIWTIHTPAIDDAYYTNAVISTLQNPELPVLGFDGIHGDLEAPLQQLIHRPQTYEVLVAFVAKMTGAKYESVFYGIVPAGFMGLAVLAQWRLLRLFVREHAWLALPIIFILILSWTTHRTFEGLDQGYGKYAYVRMFHGKGVFVTTFMPLLVAQAIRYGRRPSLETFVGLLLCQSAAGMVTSSGLVVAPFIAATAVIGSIPLTMRGLWTGALGGLASLPLATVLGLVRTEMAAQGKLRSEGSMRTIWAVFGQLDERGGLALLIGLSLPLALRLLGQRQVAWLARYQLACLVLIANPWLGPYLGKHVAKLFSSRLYWSIPLPHFVAAALAAVAVVALRGGESENTRNRRSLVWRVPTGLAAVALAYRFITVTPWPLDNPNTTFGFDPLAAKRPAAKMDVIEVARPYFDPQLYAAAPGSVAIWMSGLEDRPKLIGSRTLYVTNLTRYWGGKETRERRLLMKFAAGQSKANASRASAALSRRCVNIVILSRRATRKRASRDALLDTGFEQRGKAHGYTIWVRDELPDGCPATD